MSIDEISSTILAKNAILAACEESLELRGEDQACLLVNESIFQFRNSLFALLNSVFCYNRQVFLCKNQLASIKWNLYRECRPFMSRVCARTRVKNFTLSDAEKITRNVLTPGGSNLCAMLFVIKNVPFHGISQKNWGCR